MAPQRDSMSDDVAFEDDGWRLVVHGDSPDRAGWAGTILALSNGSIGVRGVDEERAAATTFLAGAYEQMPIHYHERLSGFAERSDTRVPVAEALGLDVTLDGEPVDFTHAQAIAVERTLDLRTGLLRRRTHWRLANGRSLTIHAERLVPIDGSLALLRRIRADADGAVALHPRLAPAPRAAGQSDDPRLGVNLGTGGFFTEQISDDLVVERLSGSGIAVAAAQRTRIDGDWLTVATGYGVGRGASEQLATAAATLAERLLDGGFDELLSSQRDAFSRFWERAAPTIVGDERLTATLRLNLFHLFASAGRDGRSSAAAKGLTGEGYEGHYFWDTEAFMLPVLAVLAPEVARAMLVYRYTTLDAARANAAALNHEGALFAWRTIEGRECSAHYPSGSAQYHINAAVAFAIGLYHQATGDDAFMAEMGAAMLVETARLWLSLGDWQGDTFHLHGVTGPDEYTAMVDDNWYTNRMAQKHLRLAADSARRVGDLAALGTREDELGRFAAAADAMHLPFDEVRDLDAQDASFLGKPRWDFAGTPADRYPLLLHFHPMTLYRHQVSKQADVALGMVLGGEEVSRQRKTRVFDYYEPITTHDSTLSASTFSILASEVGYSDAALRFFRETTLVDVDDRHGNTDHGVHMASLAGSWLALVWGFGGFRPDGRGGFALRPVLPPEWDGYDFGLAWRGAELRVKVRADGVTYSVEGAPLTFRHGDEAVTLASGGEWTGALA